MPPIIGILFTLVGIWFLFQAFRRRRYLLSQRAGPKALSSQDTEAESALAESNRPQPNSSLQQFASGCAPVVAMGMLLLALAVAAIAMLMDGPRRVSIFDVLGLLFFAGAYAFSLIMRTYYNSTTALSDDPPKPVDNGAS